MTTHKAAGPRVPVVRTLAMGLWLPALFLGGLVFVYLSAFHHTAPHDVSIAVAARPGAIAQLQHHLDAAVPGGFGIHPVFDAGEARAAVSGGDAVAGYVPDAHHPVLYVAKAAGAPLEPVVQQTFTAVSRATGKALVTRELVPAAPGNSTGTGALYLVLACTLPPYFVVVSMQRAVGFGRWAHVATITGAGVVVAVASYLGAAYAFDVIPRHPLTMLYFFLLTQAVSLTTYGLVPFLKHFFPAGAVTVFVLFSTPSSGAAVPVALVPGLFRTLHSVLPMGQATDAVRSIGYFDRHGLGQPTLVLCAWIAAGALLIAMGYVKQVRAMARGPAAGAAGPVAEPAAEDPTVYPPVPVALNPHRHPFGEEQPMLYGWVTDPYGNPLPHAVITVLTPHGRQLVRIRPDASGEYAATGFDDGVVIVVAGAPDRQAAVERCYLSIEAPALRQDFVLTSRPGAGDGVLSGGDLAMWD